MTTQPPRQHRRLPVWASFLLMFLAILAVSRIIRGGPPPADPQPVAEQKDTGPTPLQVELMAKRNLAAKMRDEESVRYQGAYVPAGAAYLCGSVNAANGFGGMTGYRRFIAGASSSMPVAIEGEGMGKAVLTP